MKVVVISDTHNRHAKLEVPEGDLLIHCGDVSGRGFVNEVQPFLDWFGSLPHRYKVFIAGNHDFCFDDERAKAKLRIPFGVHYLQDSGVEVEGVCIWGSPVTPWFHDWAFNRHWDMIPECTDVLITHGPPRRVLDAVARDGTCVGCSDLLEAVERVRPKYHLFGHIHEGYGVLEKDGTTFVNASVLDEKYELKNKPVEFHL